LQVAKLPDEQTAAEHISVIAAGRTDTGVHALEQVVHFDTLVERPLTAWVRGVNALLPDSIAVLWAHTVPDEFSCALLGARNAVTAIC